MTHRTNQKKKCDWVLWFTGIAYRNSDLKYEDAPLEQCFYARFNIIISTDMDNYYYLSLQTSPRSSREILLLLQQWGLFGEEKKGTSDFLGQVSSPSSKISIWSSKQAFSNLVLPHFFSFCFFVEWCTWPSVCQTASSTSFYRPSCQSVTSRTVSKATPLTPWQMPSSRMPRPIRD